MATIDQRQGWVARYEGNCISNADNAGLNEAGAHAECVVDGAMNALIRLRGREEATIFAFAVADRIAGGLRVPTELIFPKPPVPRPAVQPPAISSEKFGWFCFGILAALMVLR